MKLTKIKISDFRSILSQEIEFKENCIGLIGLNESGKSNVLNAIRLLETNYPATIQDKSKISRKFPSIECKYLLNEDEIEAIKQVAKGILDSVTGTPAVAVNLTTPVPFTKTVNIEGDASSVLKKTTYEIPMTFTGQAQILKKKPEITSLPDVSFRINGANITFDEINLILKNHLPEEYHDRFYDYGFPELLKDILASLQFLFDKNMPQVIFWEYNSKFLLPFEITYEDFVLNNTPYENSAPLYNIFLLCKGLQIKDVNDLMVKISTWKQDSSERRKDSAIITEKINEYIRKIWSDFNQELHIVLEQTKITIHVNDPNSDEKNFYSMEARSQGFKTFISFILTIAAEAESGIVQNFILLLDEPETHLHPSGVRYMREQLLKMSENDNYILFSTHSIFMIDRKNLQRHIKVTKINELTKLTKIGRNNFIQEAVIYEAMGTRIDEFSIGAKNIIVEGDLDLLLLEFYISLFPEQDLKKDIKDSQVWNGGGTKQIKDFLNSKILPKSSNWIIILDNDSPGQQLSKFAKEFNAKPEQSHLKINCFHYSDKSNYELEDLLPRNIVVQAFEQTLVFLVLRNENVINISDSSRVVSALTAEFQTKLNLALEIKNQFEESFKNIIYSLTEKLLEQINCITDETQKIEKFKTEFADYHQSIAGIVSKTVTAK